LAEFRGNRPPDSLNLSGSIHWFSLYPQTINIGGLYQKSPEFPDSEGPETLFASELRPFSGKRSSVLNPCLKFLKIEYHKMVNFIC